MGDKIPAGWEVKFSQSKQRNYYFNPETKESVWDLSDIRDKNNGGADNHQGEVRASHLLVKHRDSRRPSSWKEVRMMNG